MMWNEWLDTFLDEKNIDREELLEVKGPSGMNIIPVGVVADAMKAAPFEEKKKIRDVLVKIDFHNGDVLHFFKHLADALAL